MRYRLLSWLLLWAFAFANAEIAVAGGQSAAAVVLVEQQQKGKGSDRQKKDQGPKKGNGKKEVKQVPKAKKQSKPGPVKKK